MPPLFLFSVQTLLTAAHKLHHQTLLFFSFFGLYAGGADIAIPGASGPVIGAAIGGAIAYGLKHKPLMIFSSIAVGAFSYALGGPAGAFVAVTVAAEPGGLIAGKTKIGIILVPMLTIVSGGLVGQFGTWDAMKGTMPLWQLIAEIIVMHFIAPAVPALLFHLLFKKLGWVKDDYQKLTKAENSFKTHFQKSKKVYNSARFCCY